MTRSDIIDRTNYLIQHGAPRIVLDWEYEFSVEITQYFPDDHYKYAGQPRSVKVIVSIFDTLSGETVGRATQYAPVFAVHNALRAAAVEAYNDAYPKDVLSVDMLVEVSSDLSVNL